MTIHVEDRCQEPQHHHQQLQEEQESAIPPLYPVPHDKSFKPVRGTSASSQWPSEASTAQLSPCENGDFGVMKDGFTNNGSNEVFPDTGSGASVEELEKPRRPKSMLVPKRLSGRLTKTMNVHKRRNSLTSTSSSTSRHGRSVSSGTGTAALDGRVSKSGPYSLSPSAADGGLRAELLSRGEAAGAGTGRNAGSGIGYRDELLGGQKMGAFEGLKWEEYVQFKMPAEGEVRLTSHDMTFIT